MNSRWYLSLFLLQPNVAHPKVTLGGLFIHHLKQSHISSHICEEPHLNISNKSDFKLTKSLMLNAIEVQSVYSSKNSENVMEIMNKMSTQINFLKRLNGRCQFTLCDHSENPHLNPCFIHLYKFYQRCSTFRLRGYFSSKGSWTHCRRSRDSQSRPVIM